MARTDRAYRKMMRRKTMLCAEKDYRDILLRDCQEQARKKTDAYRTQLMRELYAAHPDWIPAEEAGKIVFDSRMAQFDADMASVRKQASTRAAKAISKDPACAEREEEKLQQLQKEHEELRNQYSCRLQQEISAQLTDMSGDGAEREAAVSDIERKVDAFRAEQEKAAQKQMETIRQAEDSKIRKLSYALEKLQIAPADRPGLPEGVVLRVQDLCMYFGGVHAVDGLSFDVKKGEIFGLIGPNGAGKTTVFNCITQFYKPTSGTLLFENKAGEVISLPEEKVHDVVLQGILLCKTGDDMCQGDSIPCAQWPYAKSGAKGVSNTMSVQYCDLSALADVQPQMPILWIRGDKDVMVSDHSVCDVAVLGQMGVLPGYPGADQFPPQPMVEQMRYVLERYRAVGGRYEEQLISGSGHGCMLDHEDRVVALLQQFII